MPVVPIALLAAALAASPQGQSVDRQAAATALQAARGAIAQGAPISCASSPHYAAADSCEKMTAGLARLDLQQLVYYAVTRCVVENRNALCAALTFDRGLGDGSRQELWFEARSATVRSLADVAPGGIRIGQGLATSD